MKIYDQDIFKTLPTKRQAQVLLDCLNHIDASWFDEYRRHSLLQNLDNYLNWIHWSETPRGLRPLQNLKERVLSDLTQRQLLDLIVPLERFLELSIKDDQIIPVRTQDQERGAERKTLPIFLVLDHLRSGFNVGSLYRSADCLGVSHIYLVGYTPTPSDKQVQKTALGAETWIPSSQHNSVDEVFNDLRKRNIQILALETCEQAQTLESFQVSGPTALVVGNERFGLSQKTLELVDQCVYLPMQGLKNSMNVANLLSVVTYEVARQMRAHIT